MPVTLVHNGLGLLDMSYNTGGSSSIPPGDAVATGAHSTVTGHFVNTTASGNLLVCLISGSVLANRGGAYVPVPGAPSTPGFTWVLAGSRVSATISAPDVNADGGTSYLTSYVAIYYILNAPSMASTVTTTVNVTYQGTYTSPTGGGGHDDFYGAGFALAEWNGVTSTDTVTTAIVTNTGATVDAGTVSLSTALDLLLVSGTFIFPDDSGTNPDVGSGYTGLDRHVYSYQLTSAISQYRANQLLATYPTAFSAAANGGGVIPDDGPYQYVTTQPWVCMAVAFAKYSGGGGGGGGGTAVTVTAVVPNTGPTAGGQLVIVEGTNFASPSTVSFGGSPATSVAVLSSTSLACATPAHAAGAVTVSVTDTYGTGSLANGYTYGVPAPPIVLVVTPNIGPITGGASVTIIGLNFAPDCTAAFGGLPGTGVVVVSTNTIICFTPAHAAGLVNVTVTDSVGTGTLVNGYDYVDGGVTSSLTSVQGCGVCTQPKLLNTIPGFSDLPGSALTATSPSFALHAGEISMNAAFGMVRCEVFPCTQKHGDTVPLPISCADGYVYSREELLYFWSVANSVDNSTGWISGPDSLWFANWNVDQKTGIVFSEEWYERSSSADSRLAAKSNDGSLQVFTVGQRQRTNMIMASPAAYSAVDESKIAQDKPYTDTLISQINGNAKFACVNSEVFHLGEYTTGQTVTLPHSSVDGYAYSAGECKFMHAWRWTPDASNYSQPPGAFEQAAPFQASVSSTGLVTIAVSFSTSGGNGVLPATGYGRVAVFAFAHRSASPASLPLANNFTEIDLDFFFPGETIRASTLLTIKKNTDEAILTPEFFGPTIYHDASVVSLPTSPVDGYVYSRAELQYIWSWSDTTNNSGGTHVRLPFFLGGVDKTSGAVALQCWRLPPGGPWLDDSNVNATITVLVVGTRESSHPEITYAASTPTTPVDAGIFISDVSGDQVNGS